MDIKKRVESAVHKYVKKNDPNRVKRKNAKPEKLVEKEVLDWCRSRGWFVNVIESKSTFSAKSGRYTGTAAAAGHVDITGVDDKGVFVAIELKAPGKLKTLRPAQYKFLVEVINRNGFGVCVDSCAMLSEIYYTFSCAPSTDLVRGFLLGLIKDTTPQDNSPLFEE
jgi:hypothetical protein